MTDQPEPASPLISSSFAAKLLAVVLVVVLGALLWFAGQGLVLTFAALLLAIFMRGLGDLLAKYLPGTPRTWLIAIVTLVVIAFFSLGAFLGYEIVRTISELVRNLDESVDRLREQVKSLPYASQVLAQLPPFSKMLSGGLDQLSNLQKLLLTPFGWVINLLFIMFVGIYFALRPEPYHEGTVRLFPVWYRDRVREVSAMVADQLWHWCLARIFTMFITGLFMTVLLLILGIPLAIPLGILTGFLSFVPNVGAILAVIPPLLLGFSQGGWTPMWVLIGYIVMQQIEGYILTPIVQEREVNLLPGFVIVAQLMFGLLMGTLGVAFATPIALTILILVREFYVTDYLEKPSPRA